MTGLNNQSYLFEVIRRPTDDETTKTKIINKQKSSVGHIILTTFYKLNHMII